MNIGIIRSIFLTLSILFLAPAQAGQRPHSRAGSSSNVGAGVMLVAHVAIGACCIYSTVRNYLNRNLERAQRSLADSIALHRAASYGRVGELSQILNANRAVPGKEAALIAAARNGHRGTVVSLVDAGASIDGQDENGKTALMHAAQQGRMRVLQELVRRGASHRARDNSGQTPLLLATRFRSPNTAVRLAQLPQAPVNVPGNDYKRTPLMWASQNGLIEVINALLENNSEPVDLSVRDIDENTALLLAVQNAHSQVAQRLIAAGADSNERDGREQKTVFMWAAQRGLSDMVSILAPQVDVSAQDEHGHTAEDLAVRNGCRDVVHILRTRALFAAAQAGNRYQIMMLINQGANFNARDEHGKTPLMYAAQAGHEQAVRGLFRRGANVCEQDNQGNTAVDLAEANDHPEIADILFDNAIHRT